MKKQTFIAVLALLGLASCGGNNTSSQAPVSSQTPVVTSSETESSVAETSSIAGQMDFDAWSNKITTALEAKSYAQYQSFTITGSSTGGNFNSDNVNMGFGVTWSDTTVSFFMNDANMTVVNEYQSKETHTDEEKTIYTSYVIASKEKTRALLTVEVGKGFDYSSNMIYCYDETTKTYSFQWSGTTAYSRYYWNENLLLTKVEVKSGDLLKNLSFSWSKDALADTTYNK